jgi:hypothetical protein
MNIAATNQRLEELLRELQGNGSYDERNTAARAMNGLLCRAIADAPTQVNAVEIVASVSSSLDTTREGYSLPQPKRSVLQQFLRQQFPVEQTRFVMLLPYTAHKGQGTGQCETVSIRMPVQTGNQPYCAVDLGTGGTTHNSHALLYPEELQRVALIQAPTRDFTDGIRYMDPIHMVLERPVSPVEQYLFYRGFSHVEHRHDNNEDLSADVRELLPRLLVPNSAKLWTHHSEHSTDYYKAFTGYVVLYEDEKPVLYHFNRTTRVSRVDDQKYSIDEVRAIQVADVIIGHKQGLFTSDLPFTTYTGDDIIKELARVG